MALDTTTDVDTPEHVRFRYFLAGPMRRAGAYLIDTLVRGVILTALWMILAASAGGDERLASMRSATGVMLVVMFLLEWGYFVALELLWDGRSIGKRALDLRVVKHGGYPITFLDSVLRNLLRAADFLPVGYALGFLVSAFDARFCRLGDLVAGTIVVVEPSRRVAVPLEAKASELELAALPHRVVLSTEELEAIELFLRRLGTISSAREAELAQMLAPQIATRLGVRFHDGTAFLRSVYVRATA